MFVAKQFSLKFLQVDFIEFLATEVWLTRFHHTQGVHLIQEMIVLNVIQLHHNVPANNFPMLSFRKSDQGKQPRKGYHPFNLCPYFPLRFHGLSNISFSGFTNVSISPAPTVANTSGFRSITF